MNNLPKIKLSSKSSILLIIGAILLAAGICGGYFWLYYKDTGEKPPAVPLPPHLPYTILPLNKIPDVFPNGIPVPVEPPNLLLLSYSQIVGNREQTTIQFITSKSAAETFELYKDYLNDKEWTISSAIEQETLRSMSAKKGMVFLSVTINSKESGWKDVVDLTLVAPKKTTELPPEFKSKIPAEIQSIFSK